MKIIIHPTYFPNIDLLSQLIKSENILFEISDKYIKQTLRNRTEIHAANGKLILSIPVKYSSSKKEKYKDIKICYNSSWQKIHLKSPQIKLLRVGKDVYFQWLHSLLLRLHMY